MKNNLKTIKSFVDLNTWKKCHQLILNIYDKTKSYPKDERYSLVDQIRRAAVSITSNIAEGYGRSSIKEKLRFYSIAKGSLIEVQNQLIISKDVGYLNKEDFSLLKNISTESHKLLNGLIRSTKTRIQNT